MPDKNTPYMVLTFHEDGTVSTEAHNFKGKACTKATKFIEDALGTVKDRKFKHEYNDDFFNEGQTNSGQTA
jgi:Protein of unknown function (DUF2997)